VRKIAMRVKPRQTDELNRTGFAGGHFV
jgi:hypothetical protein